MVILINEGCVMVEPRLIYAALMWYIWVGQRLYKGHLFGFYTAGGKILYGGEKILCSRYCN